jgi:phosphoribosylformylglycinamidine synthase subunit PurS
MRANVYITLKNGVLDPQGKAVEGALSNLGFDGVKSVRQGKLIEIELDEKSPAAAKEKLKTMCEKLLANTVVENYRFDVVE